MDFEVLLKDYWKKMLMEIPAANGKRHQRGKKRRGGLFLIIDIYKYGIYIGIG